MLSIRSGTEFPASKKPGPLNLDLKFYQSNVPSPIDTKKSLLTVYILYSEDAGHESMRDYGDDCKDPSVCPHQIYDDLLNRLSEAWISCGESKENPTVVEVRGFASAGLTKDIDPDKLQDEYKRVENEDDDIIKRGKAFNLYIAEKRAKNLVTEIKRIVENNLELRKYAHKFRIYSHKWEMYQDMVISSNIDDTEKGEYEKPRGFLTRRAEIPLLEAPGCEKDI